VTFEQLQVQQWINKERWMSSDHECDWYGVECVDIPIPNTPLILDNTGRQNDNTDFTVEERMIIQIDLPENNIRGSIPREIGYLPTVTRLGLWNNGLVGTIPTTLGRMKQLVKLYLDITQDL